MYVCTKCVSLVTACENIDFPQFSPQLIIFDDACTILLYMASGNCAMGLCVKTCVINWFMQVKFCVTQIDIEFVAVEWCTTSGFCNKILIYMEQNIIKCDGMGLGYTSVLAVL